VVLGREFVAEVGLGPEFAEFGCAFVKETVGEGSGAVYGPLDLLGVGVGGFHGVEDVPCAVVEADDEVGFDFAAAAETPHGAADFVDEIVFERTAGGEIGAEGFVELGVDIVFAGTDEVAGGEEAVGDGVLGGDGFAFFGAGASAGVGCLVRDIVREVWRGRHF